MNYNWKRSGTQPIESVTVKTPCVAAVYYAVSGLSG